MNLKPISDADAVDMLHGLRLRIVDEMDDAIQRGDVAEIEAHRKLIRAIEVACDCLLRRGVGQTKRR